MYGTALNLLVSMVYVVSKNQIFTIRVLVPDRCRELKDLIAAACIKVRNARLLGGNSMVTCVNLINFGFEPCLLRQKTRMSTIRPSGRF